METADRKHIFIVNPVSGKRKHTETVRMIQKHFSDPSEYEIFYTEYVGHAKEIAEQFEGNYRIYSVGGDGTAHEILNGLKEGVELALIPVGSGNDFARMITRQKDLDLVISDMIKGQSELVDVGLANGELFLNCLNVGLDAEVNVRANRIRKRFIPRQLVYIYAAIFEVIKNFELTLSFVDEDGVLTKNIVLASVMNGKWYGGGFKSAPEAELDDGLFDLCRVKALPRRKIFPLLPVYFQGKHTDNPAVTMKKLSTLLIYAQQPFTYGCDGEIFETERLDIRILPKVLPLVRPRAFE